MKHFDEFKLVWEENFKQNRNKFPHLIFIAVYPDKLKWDFGVEKQTQTTCLHISGGPAGAGSGHTVKLLYQSEFIHTLRKFVFKTQKNCVKRKRCQPILNGYFDVCVRKFNYVVQSYYACI